MLEKKNDLSRKLEQLREACNESGSLLVEASFENLLDSCYLDLDGPTFLSLVSHERPTAVFFQTVDYEPDRFIRVTMAGEGWKESWEHDPVSIWPTPDDIKAELRAELNEVSDQVGLPRSLMVTYALQGLPRLCWMTAEWSEQLSDKIIGILDSRHERAEKEEEQIAHELDSLISEVANDPAFRAIRGRPKRLLFVQKKYGDRIPPHPLGRISTPAQNCDAVDHNLATVLIKADDQIWLEKI